MKAVILAAGKATRMGKLCETIHKCMLPVGGKPLLEWNMEKIFDYVDDFVIVVGYRKEDIINYFGFEFKGKKITYVEQKEQKGTGHALLQVKDIVNGKFVVLMGDDWYPSVEIPNELTIFGQRVEDSSKFGILETNDGKLVSIVEKPEGRKNELVNMGFYVLDENIFEILERLKESPRGEIELTDAVVQLKPLVKEIEGWMGIAYPWELFEVNKIVLEYEDNIGIIKDTLKVNEAKVNLKNGTVILHNCVIEGPVYIGKNCKIGPNAYLRAGTSIGNNCHIGSSEIKNSIIMDRSNVPHFSYVGDSVIGRDCNLGAGTMIANLRFDDKTIKCESKGRRDTGLRKLGVIMCDNVKTGVNVSIMPGVVISSGQQIKPGEIVARDL
jgi:UDP-N-acetylglucosamine diphosphorylase / glucose-1-phosphate thymidylyltransferase / UDP-N-acetylgalactosamine diphosphorylase / glucosamine-1-phosphate N-acetyltransferase / galactosamine-1-phosphate N-acetyltransferase